MWHASPCTGPCPCKISHACRRWRVVNPDTHQRQPAVHKIVYKSFRFRGHHPLHAVPIDVARCLSIKFVESDTPWTLVKPLEYFFMTTAPCVLQDGGLTVHGFMVAILRFRLQSTSCVCWVWNAEPKRSRWNSASIGVRTSGKYTSSFLYCASKRVLAFSSFSLKTSQMDKITGIPSPSILRPDTGL